MTNKKLYLEVKEKVKEAKGQDEEIGDLIEDSNDSVLLEVATAEESNIESHYHSPEVATAQEDDALALSILEQIMWNMEKEKECEKVRIEAKRK